MLPLPKYCVAVHAKFQQKKLNKEKKEREDQEDQEAEKKDNDKNY